MAETHPTVSGSRPSTSHSDASFATAFEQPISPYSVTAVAQGIDHVISLVNTPRTTAHRRTGSGASRASSDRDPSPTTPTQAHVVRELELLKRLLSDDHFDAGRSGLDLSGNDPVHGDTHDGPSEEHDYEEVDADPQLARAREGLLLHAAERRVKVLTSENEVLHQSLRAREEEIETTKTQSTTDDSSLQDARSHVVDLQRQLRKLQESSQEQQNLIESLRSEKQRTDSAYESEHSPKAATNILKEQATKIPQLILPGEITDHMSRDATGKRSKGRSRSATPRSRQSSAANADLEKQLAEVELVLIDLEGKKARNDALAKEVEDYKTRLEAATVEKETYEQQLQMIEAKHTHLIQELRSQVEAGREKSATALEEIKSMHAKAVEDQKTSHAQEMERLQLEHAEQASFTNIEHRRRLESGEEALKLSRDKETVLEHRIRELTEALTSQKPLSQHATEAPELQQTIDKGTELDRRTGQAEVRNLKKRHQEAIAQIRATAQRQLENQRVELENAHQAAMAAALTQAQGAAVDHSSETSVRYQSEISRLEGEHRLRMAELETQNQEKITFELLLKEDAIKAEMKALQDRLDASLTGQAEAERSIAHYRQQKFEADKRLAEAEASFKKRFEAAQHETSTVAEQLKRTQASLQELEDKSAGDAKSPSANTKQELSSAKVQVSNLEKSRAETQALWQKALEEKSELIRQNDFLVKELEALLTQRSKPRAPAANRREASVQTDEFLPLEPKADLAGMREWKDERRKAQPSAILISPSYQQVKDEIETAWENRTFEQHPSNAQAELPELERAISANQVLFAGKLHEHLSGMQQARHQIAIDYQSKLNSLASEKDKMDKMVTSSHIADFAEQHELLLEKISSNVNVNYSPNSPGTPIDDVMELRLAEEQLVQEFDRRLVERKSQIALQYAAKFQAMTQEYDQEISQLLHQGRPPAADAVAAAAGIQRSPISTRSVRSTRTNDDNDRPRPYPVTPDARSAKATTTTAATTSSPTPQSITSIPRAVMFPGNRHSPDATSQPRSATKSFRNWNIVAQHSLMRAKSPAGILKTPASIASDKSSDSKSVASPLREKSGVNGGGNDGGGNNVPSEDEGDPQREREPGQDQQQPPPKIPLPRASMESSIPRPGIPTRAKERKSIGPGNPLRSKSMRLSSGMIYYHAPRQSITNAS